MNYLASPEATLVTMWVTARYILKVGAATEADLKEALRPSDLTSGTGQALASSLSVGSDLGVFVRGEQAAPVHDIGGALKQDNGWFDEFDGFAHVARELLVRQSERAPEEWSDVARAATALLSRDWRRASDRDHRDPLMRELVPRNEQWVAFLRWSRELGIGHPRSSQAIWVDPTPTIRRDLASASGASLTARQFVDFMGRTLPTGPRHPLAWQSSGDEDPPDDLELFPSVGFALKRLEREGLLRMRVVDDAKERLIYRFPGPNDEYLSVTHIELCR